jgi:hypothetical protein
MASPPVRDPVGDHLLTPQNAVFGGGRLPGLPAELQRDCAREETAAGVGEIVLTERLLRA